MSKKMKQEHSGAIAPSTPKENYKHSLHELQAELVKLQRHFIGCNDKILIILEGRDASGKDGTIKQCQCR
jgi:polyphosphate kinase